MYEAWDGMHFESSKSAEEIPFGIEATDCHQTFRHEATNF